MKKTKYRLYLPLRESHKCTQLAIENFNHKAILHNSTHLQTSFFKVSVLENWNRKDPKIIFLNDQSVADFLLNIRIDRASNTDLPTPFEIFTVATPQHCKVNGIELPPFLGTICKPEKLFDETISYTTSLGINQPIQAKRQYSGQLVSIAYKRKKDTAFHSFSEEALSDLIKIDLSSLSITQTAELYEKLNTSIDRGLPLSDIDKAYGILTARLLLSIGIFNHATSNSHLTPGIPNHIKYSTKNSSEKGDSFTIQLPNMSSGTSPKSHLRSPHLRNLVDPRYYQGENADLAPGSRWTFVSGTVINGTPYTQHN